MQTQVQQNIKVEDICENDDAEDSNINNKYSKLVFVLENLVNVDLDLTDDLHSDLLRFNKELVQARFQRRNKRCED